MQSRVVLVTGAARGIGREVAERLREDGWSVHAVHRSPERRAELEERFGAERAWGPVSGIPTTAPRLLGTGG